MGQEDYILPFFSRLENLLYFSHTLKKPPSCDASELLFSSICLWHVNFLVWMDRQERYSWNLLTTWVRFFTSPILREFCKVINSMLVGQNVSRKKKTHIPNFNIANCLIPKKSSWHIGKCMRFGCPTEDRSACCWQKQSSWT